MNGLLLLAAAMVGVDVGWQPLAGGGFEYIIQIEPDALEALAAGHDILSEIPEELRGVRRYRITVGTDPLPRIGTPPHAAALRQRFPDREPAESETAPSRSGSPFFRQRNSYAADLGDEATRESQALSPADGDDALPRKAEPADPFDSHLPKSRGAGPDIASGDEASADDQDSPAGSRSSQPSGSRYGQFQWPAEPAEQGAAGPFAGSQETPVAGSGTAEAGSATRTSQPGGSSPGSSRRALSKGAATPASQSPPSEPPPRLFEADGQAHRLASYRQVESPTPGLNKPGSTQASTTPAGEPKPWLMTVLALFGSLGGNAYLGWLAWGQRAAYRRLLTRFKQRRAL